MISYAELDRSADRLGVTKDVSSGGISFEVVGVESTWATTSASPFAWAITRWWSSGIVVWATDTDPLTQEVGIEFYEIDPRSVRLLDEMVRHRMDPR